MPRPIDTPPKNEEQLMPPLPKDAPGIPGASSEPIEVTPQMERDFADAAPSEGSGVTGSVHPDQQKDGSDA
jgi:hypothetical protein